MVFEYELPDVGEGVAEGEVVAWHVSVGDRVEEDDVLAEIETDKAVVDLPSPVDGTIVELHAEEGEVVRVGSVVVTIDTDDGDEAGETTADTDEAVSDAGGEQATSESEESPSADEAAETPVAEGRVFAPPNVRRLARELGVDITTVDGSGPSGRVTESDVRAAAESDDSDDESETGRKSAVSKRSDGESGRKSAVSKRSSGESGRNSAVSKRRKAGSTTDGSAEAADRGRTLAVPSTRQVARDHGVDIDEVPTDKERDGEPFVEPEEIEQYVAAQEAATAEATDTAAEAEADTTAADAEADAASATATGDQPVSTEPYRGIRRTIGNQMQTAAQTIPHATHHDKAVVDELVETRAELKPRAEKRGTNLTYMPFVLKALVAGLKEFPVLNTELDEENEEILYKEYYNVGIAVATDAGLMVPVLKDVDQKGILELASEVTELAEKARSREIAPGEMQDGTITVTNFGAIGGEYATPIINHPETAILGLGSIEQRPVAVDGEVVARETLPLSLSIDHRVIDGAEAAQFTNTVIEHLENPALLLLE